MNLTAKDVAQFVNGKLQGQPDCKIESVAKIHESKKGDLTFLYLPAYQKHLKTTKASAILIKPDIEKTNTNITYIEVENPDIAFQKIIIEYFSPEYKLEGIDKSARVAESVELGENVALGKNVVVGNNNRVGSNTRIFHNSVLLDNVVVGNNCIIYPNVTIREDCVIGDNVIIHSGSVIGSDGFGYAPRKEGGYDKVPQIGNVVLEDDVEIGSNVSIDRAALGSTIIRKGVKIDNLVQIAHNVEVGANTAISAQTGIAGSTKIGKNCILAGQVGIVGHIEITDNVILGAQSGVSKSINRAGRYFGYPAKDLGTSLRLEGHVRNLPKYAERIKELGKKIEELEKKLNQNSEDI
jgi:UDP-3-O-[3-hydroxymyristoyl] glucosamine N-acyltransferase